MLYLFLKLYIRIYTQYSVKIQYDSAISSAALMIPIEYDDSKQTSGYIYHYDELYVQE